MQTTSHLPIITALSFLLPLASPAHEVGNLVGPFEATDDAGQLWKSTDHVGKGYVVVYFSPAAMTGGCTKQACAYRDSRDALLEAGITVVGVSGDTPEGLRLFKQAEDLNFTLLSDTEGKVARAFGVPVKSGGELEREVGGAQHILKRGVTTARWTFVIAPDGSILSKNTAVRAATDSKDILALIRSNKRSN